jgi:hippurate hydrolase
MRQKFQARRLSSLAIASLTLCAASAASALDVGQTLKKVDEQLAQSYAGLDALYKDLHAQPELGFQEVKTAARLAKEMRALGFEVTEKIGQTGIVAIYKNGPGKTVLVRTELDALPMEEKSGLPFASKAKAMWNGAESPVAHSCGHDIHMASWVGTAKALVAFKDQWKGTLMFVGQPAEETVNGAQGMINDGLFKRFGKPDMGFALHVSPEPAGMVGYRPGVVTSNSDGLDIVFKGRGGHGSMPSATIDPIMMASRFVVDVQSVISREKDASQFGVITVGAFQSGTVGNIIPDSAQLRGTIRSYTPEVRKVLHTGIERTAKAVADMSGAESPQVKINKGGNAVVNDAALTETTAGVFKAAFGPRAVLIPAPSPASEDYSDFIIAGVPSVFFIIGGSDPAKYAELKAAGKPVPVNHSPFFAPVAEPSIKTGVRAMTLAVMNVMQ